MPKSSRRASPIPLRAPDAAVRLNVRVQPKASRDQIRVEPDGRLKVHLTSPPVDGAANSALCALLSDFFSVSKSSVQVVRGERGRDKQVAIAGVSEEFIHERIEALGHSSS